MKTVMKKMFCLLLVAVLLVGIMPFAAFAEETKHCDTCNVDGHEETDDHCTRCGGQYGHTADDEHCSDPKCGWYGGHNHEECTAGCNESATCAWEHAHKETCLSKATCTYCGAAKDHFSANCPTTCSRCSNQRGHDETDEHCPVCGWYGGHDHDTCTYGCNESATCTWEHKHKDTCVKVNSCTHCGTPGAHRSADCPNVCQTCKAAGTYTTAHAAADHCTHCNVAPGATHLDSCPTSPNYYSTCDKCNARYVTVNKHPECDICDNKNVSPVARTTGCHATADCPYCEVCWDKGDEVTSHATSAHCPKCDTINGHAPLCENKPVTGSSQVKVYVNLYTGDVKTATKELVVYYEDSNTSISDTITEHKALISAELADQYPNYEWYGNVYDSENEDGQNMNDKVGKGINIHINAHSKENLVYLYIHDSRTYDRIGIVRLHGKKVGETVTESEVRKAVKGYYSFTHLSMYDTEKWDDYVDGKTVTPDGTLTIGSSHYVIDVKISGSVKSSSSYTADSTNPKTGDEIFVPMAVLGLSASALAVMFYLNKKRAY